MLTKALLKLVVQYNWKTIRSLCCNGLPHHFQGSCLLISTSKEEFCFWVSMGFTPADLLGPQGKKAFLYIASRINFAICEVWNGRDTSYLGENTEKENRQDERKEGGREQLLVMLPSWIGVLSSQIRKALWHMRCWAIRNSPSKRLYLRHSLISKIVVLPLFVSLYFGHWIINWTIFFPLKGRPRLFFFLPLPPLKEKFLFKQIFHLLVHFSLWSERIKKKSFSYFLLFSTLVEEAKGGRERWGFYIDNNSFWHCLIKEPIVHFCSQQIKLLSKVFGFCRHVLKCGWSYGLPSPWSPSWLTMRKDKLDHKVLTCHTQTLVTKREKKFLHPTPLRWDFNSIFFRPDF